MPWWPVFCPYTDAVNKVTIIPRGRAAGVTWFLPEERDFKYKDQLQSELSVAYGGRVAEELIFNRISTGAAGDIKMATDLASRMVRSWGMSDLGPLSYAKDEEHIFIGREIAQHRDFSEETARRIDEETTKFINNAYEKALTVLKDNIDILHRLSEVLLEKETVMGSELDAIILEMRPDFDFPSKHEHVSTPAPEKNDKADESQEAESASEAEDATEALGCGAFPVKTTATTRVTTRDDGRIRWCGVITG
jgi:cell division protease FtsH